MASSEVKVEGSDTQLKHLGLARILALNTVVLVSNLYDYAKQSCGPLKSTVGKVENAVTAVVGPAVERYRDVPSDILVFLDKKVDELTNKFDECASPGAKKVMFKAQSLIKNASQVAQDLLAEAKVAGPLAAVSHAATISKHIAVSQLAVVWYKANQYPALHGVFKMAVPTAAYWSEKYNELVKGMSAKGCGLFNYVPLVPVDEMTKAYKQVEAGAGKKADVGSSSESESDKE